MGRRYTVADVMTERVVTLREEDSLGGVLSNLDRFRFRHIPVVDGRTVVGIVTQRDLLRRAVSTTERGPAATAKARGLEERTFVAEIMTRDPDVVSPDASVSEAAEKMVHGHFGALPVVDAEGGLIGIVTSQDLLQLMAQADVTKRDETG